MHSNKAILEFEVEKAIFNELAKDEKKIYPVLIKAAKIIGDIYLEQENNDLPGANFYPTNVSNEQIEKEAKKNPSILSPYTVVEKVSSRLVATPYHLKHKKQLQEVSDLLKQASKISQNKAFAKYLEITSGSLLTGDYRAMDKAWLSAKDSTLQFLAGPYERYLDRRFFKKMAYLSFVGIQDSYYTQKARDINHILLNSVGEKPHRYISFSQIQMYTLHNVIFAGYNARSLISSQHIPSDDQTIKESGSRLIGFLSSMDLKFDKLLYPIFKSIFEKKFRASYTEELLRRANYYLMLVYGLTRQLHRWEGSRERLKELYPVFDEVNSIVSGIQHSKHLVLKGVIDQKDLEAMIIMHICWCFSEWVFSKSSSIRFDYLRGDALALGFYFQNQALRQAEGISWPNFSKIFFVIENLSTIYVRLLSEGSHKDAEKFLRDNLSYEIFKAFDPKLSKIKFSLN